MKIFVLVMLIAIVASLGSGLYFLSKDDQGSPRMLNALKIRVALSAILVVTLVVAYFTGWIAPPSPE
ncbi:MAG: twin transmembrane helix small protein [Woeseia sp.]|nr:twin transmembrane helix small protein [Woeseia sp.]NNL55208.1 twin transmembrane helix small protein [Woeseia sp.]